MHIDSSRHSFGFACWAGDPGPMTGAHRHDDVEVNIADGEVSYLLGGSRLSIPAGRVGIFWGSRPHQLIDVAPGTRVTWLTIPLAEFLSWGLPEGFVAALVQGRLLIPDFDPADIGPALARWGEELRSPADFVVRTARLEIQAFVRRLSLSSDSGSVLAHAAGRGALESAGAMAAYIATSFAGRVAVADVADSVHLHPSYAMAVFKRIVGVSIGDYLAQCRVAEAQRLLISSRMPVREVSFASGFGSLSRFHEVFRSVCGMTPAGYRAKNAVVSPPVAVTRTRAR